MPDKKGRFTGREKIFAERYASTGDAVYAAEKAGYSSPRQAASQNANNPAIVAECRRMVQHQLATETLPAASKRHLALLQDERTQGQVLIRAIDLGYRYGLAPVEGSEGKEAHEMTGDELQAMLDRLRRELVERMSPVVEHEAPEPLKLTEAAGVFE